MKQNIQIINKISSSALLALTLYQFWIVIDRWVAVFHYLAKFGADSGPWITLGLDTVIFGYLSLFITGSLSFFSRYHAKKRLDSWSIRLSTIAFIAIIFTTIVLSVLIILPAIEFRK